MKSIPNVPKTHHLPARASLAPGHRHNAKVLFAEEWFSIGEKRVATSRDAVLQRV